MTTPKRPETSGSKVAKTTKATTKTAGGETVLGKKGRTVGKALFRKRSDVIAEEVKRWIVTENMSPGDKLPQEKELTELFDSSRWTIREALKSLEVQGLITITSGPRGGASVAEVSQENAVQHLANYFYFKPLTVSHIYDLRVILEPIMAREAVEHLTEEQLDRMVETIEITKNGTKTQESRRQRREAELEFHNILAEACPNEMVTFICRFLNDLLNDWVVFNQVYAVSNEKFSCETQDFHESLLDAFRQKDSDAVQQLMMAHMKHAAFHTVESNGEIERKFFPG